MANTSEARAIPESLLSIPAHAPSNLKGIAWAVLAIGIFAFFFIAGKLAGGAASASQIMWMRYAGGFITVLVIVLISGTRSRDLKTPQFHVHVLRASCGGFGGMAAIYAATHMPVANATAIGLLDGLFMVLLGVVWLGEKVTPQQWGAALTCLAGAAIVVAGYNGFAFESATLTASLVAMAGALLLAVESILIKRLARSENALVVLFYVNLFGTLLFAIPGLINWQPIGLLTFAFLALGPLAIAGQACNIQAFRLADAALLGPVKYAWIVFGAAFGWLFFAEIPPPATYAGGGLIIAGGVALALSRSRN